MHIIRVVFPDPFGPNNPTPRGQPQSFGPNNPPVNYYLGPVPPAEAFLSMFTFLVLISVFYFIPTGVIIMWSPSVLGAGLCAILYLSEIVVGVVSAGILTDEPFGWREIVGSSMIVLGGVLAMVLAPKES